MFTNRRYLALGLILVLVLVFLSCAPGNDRWDQKISPGHKAGFWVGIWHGLIIIITFIVSLFTNEVGLYEVSNTGWPYNLGFLIGLFCSIGGGIRIGRKKWTRKWRIRKDEWDEIGDKIEEKVRRGVKTWLEETKKEDKEQEWAKIANMIEEKIKETLRKWAEKE